jgi:hypothetical protein
MTDQTSPEPTPRPKPDPLEVTKAQIRRVLSEGTPEANEIRAMEGFVRLDHGVGETAPLPIDPRFLIRRLDEAWEIARDRRDSGAMIAAVDAMARLTSLPELIRQQHAALSTHLSRLREVEQARVETTSEAFKRALPDIMHHLQGILRGNIPASSSERTQAALKLMELGITKDAADLDAKCEAVEALHGRMQSKPVPPRAPGV